MPPTMSLATVKTLCWAEYDFAQLMADVQALHDRLAPCAAELPRAAVACRQLRTLKGMIAHVLGELDRDITAAVQAAQEAPEAAPF